MTSDPIRRWSRSAASGLEERRTRVDDDAMSSARLRTPLSFLTLILGTALAAESPPIPIDGVEDWAVIEQQVRDAVGHEAAPTGLILTRDDRPVANVAVTANGFGETTTDPAGGRWVVPVMLQTAIDDMPAWRSIRIPDADDSGDAANPTELDAALAPTLALAASRLAVDAARAARSLLESRDAIPVLDPTSATQRPAVDPFRIPVVSSPRVDPADPQAPVAIALWFLESDARQADLRVRGEREAADRIAEDMRTIARRLRLPEIEGLIAARLPRGMTGFASLCLHETWPTEAWTIHAALPTLGREIEARRTRLRGLAGKLARAYDLSPEASELFEQLLGISLDRVLPVGFQIDRNDWRRFEEMMTQNFEQYWSGDSPFTDQSGFQQTASLLELAWNGQSLLGGEASMTSTERFARDAQRAWLADQAMPILEATATRFGEATAEDMRAGAIETLALSISPVLQLPMQGDSAAIVERLHQAMEKVADWETRGVLTPPSLASQLVAEAIAEVMSKAALRDPFDAQRPPVMRSRSDGPRPAIARGGVMFVSVPLPDGRTVLVPRVSVTPRMPGP